MHIAMTCPDLTGHLNPMTTLGRALAAHGHRVTLFGLPPSGRHAAATGLGYVAIGAPGFEQQIEPGRNRLAELTGVRALLLTGRLLQHVEEIALRELPDAFRAARIDAVVADQISPGAASVATALGLPLAIVCNALNIRQEAAVPPAILGWRYRDNRLSRFRNVIGNRLLSFAARHIRRSVNRYRRANGLAESRAGELTAREAVVEVAQQPAFFDFPRQKLPPSFHYTGPWHAADRDARIQFPWERLDGRPLIYASLGTLQNRLTGTFAAIIEACQTLPVQLVVALGRGDATWNGPTPNNTVVVPFAPQLPLLQRAALAITHAGLNSALEALAAGVPMVCLPVTNDQPGVAERVRWLGAGAVLKPRRATAARLRELIQHVLNDERYRATAQACREMIQKSPGVAEAAALIERAFDLN